MWGCDASVAAGVDLGMRLCLLDALLDELLAELPAILLVGPRASGKTTTALQRAQSVIRLDVPGEAAAFRATRMRPARHGEACPAG